MMSADLEINVAEVNLRVVKLTPKILKQMRRVEWCEVQSWPANCPIHGDIDKAELRAGRRVRK